MTTQPVDETAEDPQDPQDPQEADLFEPRPRSMALRIGALLTAGLLAVFGASFGAEWPNWRGPEQNAVSPETGLISEWSQDGASGKNLIWRQDFTGRSTPVVFDGKVCANGRAGEGIRRQERVACFDAESGKKLWERRFNVWHSTVPWNRVGWANVTADPETGYLYVQGVGGLFHCLDSDTGETVWWRNLTEDFNFMEGYGGRTQTPTVDEDRVIVHFGNHSWGDQRIPRHRIFSFDKRTGELIWVASPASSMADANSQSTPVIAFIDGQRMVVAGNGDGWIYAHQARTGKYVWGFHLSKRAINTTVLVDGDTVYATHSEENLDEPSLGRVVAIDATGRGDVTATHEKWRADYGVGFSSPIKHGDRLYVMENSADLHALDAATGEAHWEINLGTVGKGSPVWADGRIYVTEVNGNFHIVRPGEESAEVLDTEFIEMPDGRRYAEIYGSPAIAYGRIYFTTEEGIYCLGDPDKPFERTGAESSGEKSSGMKTAEAGPEGDGEPTTLLLVPAEIELTPGEALEYQVRGYTPRGRFRGEVPGKDLTWSLDGLDGEIRDGRFVPAKNVPYQTGKVVAKRGGVTAEARVRVIRPIPMREDFESHEVGSHPEYLKGAVARYAIGELDGNKVMAKEPAPGLHRHDTFIGRPHASDYTIQADVLGTRDGRRVADVGLINSGYIADLQGALQRLQIRSWSSALRMMQERPFSWDPGKWYTMKFQVRPLEDKALVRAKVWPKGEDEPAEWTLTVEDPLPITQGSPGLIGYTPSPGYWDNLVVTPNEVTPNEGGSE